MLETNFPKKKIMIVEAGYYHAWQPNGSDIIDLSALYPITPEGQQAFTKALIETLKKHKNVNGLYWWFPEANEYGINYTNCVTTQWYNCGWWDNANGQVMDALFVMPDFLEGSGEEPVDSTSIYIVGGEGSWSLTNPMSEMTNLGNGTYVDTLVISAPIYFVFADGGPDAWNNDWNSFNSTYRYGPASRTTVTTGTQYSTAKRNNNYSYYFTGDGSEYLFTFDLNALTFTLAVIEHPDIMPGDANDDKTLSIVDVTTLINYLLVDYAEPFNELNADVNQDHLISISDVTSLINLLLTME
jgi:hypothetical protein